MKLLGFDYTIEYHAGSSNQVDDGLSHSFYMTKSIPHVSLLSELRTTLQQCSES